MNYKSITTSLFIFAAMPSLGSTLNIKPDIKGFLPIMVQEPNLYQAPKFDYFDFSEGYLSTRAEATAKLPIVLENINRVCVEMTHNQDREQKAWSQSGLLVYSYVNSPDGNKEYNRTIGFRSLLEDSNEHCFDEEPSLYQTWQADKYMTFTPYTSTPAFIKSVNIRIDGDISISQDPSEFVAQYYDFVSKVGFDQAAVFFHSQTINELKSFILVGLENNNETIEYLKDTAFGTDVTISDIEIMTDIDFMNQMLSVIHRFKGSNTTQISSLNVVGEIDYQDKKLITVEKIENEVTSYEVVVLKEDQGHWKIDLREKLKSILGQ
ncbi:hypothetical protein BS333_18350 [Vibrio azureus]|uniref:Uncharacterized protein n=1 Tax=Vibrio azureus NBRC 104587 TaxID=1219077 RepID=U3ASN2_9VIBR|nr:hypothetical protein [Vibrio azureus]AUI88299.1 hypothetical protein BS333_18350 [Vibrio azureus]GAD76760.1 hypothetical protein VAZ01S_052_00030 [Vibrio azureus NBRC 104587]